MSIYISVAVLLKPGSRRRRTWVAADVFLSLAALFGYPGAILCIRECLHYGIGCASIFHYLLMLFLVAPLLYFVPASGCNIAWVTTSITTAWRTILVTDIGALSAFGTITTASGATISITAIGAIALAILHCKYFLWVFALFFLSAAIRHAITVLGAILLAATCLTAGVLWNIPASGNYVDRAIAGFLLFLLDALHGCGRCVAAIIVPAAGISKIILAAMQKLTCKRFYQVLAVLGLVLLYVYITLACVFVAGATIIVVLVVSSAMHSPAVLLYYMVCFFIMAY